MDGRHSRRQRRRRPKRDYALELGDIIVACVTELCWGLGYDEEMPDELMRAVELKNRRRGYYE